MARHPEDLATVVAHHRLDVDAIAAAPTRVVIAVGAETGDTLTGRTTSGVPAALDTDVVEFPGGHGGFMGGEYGQVGEPDAFAARLREVLDGAAGLSPSTDRSRVRHAVCPRDNERSR